MKIKYRRNAAKELAEHWVESMHPHEMRRCATEFLINQTLDLMGDQEIAEEYAEAFGEQVEVRL